MAEKITTYVIIFSGVLLLFYFGGLLGGGANSLLDFLLNSQDFSFSEQWTTLLIGIGGLAVGVAAGWVTKDPYVGVMTSATIYLGGLLSSFVIVYQKVYAEVNFIAILIFAPLMLLLLISLLEWWRGRD